MYKGNTHTHTNMSSDGDQSPHEVIKWYADHDYDFLVITDHNYFTKINPDDSSIPENFLFVPGEEITQWIKVNGKDIAVHVNGIGLSTLIPKMKALTAVELIQKNIDAVLKQDAIAQINHPNFYFSQSHHDILETNGAILFEIYNGSSANMNDGDIDHDSMEVMWDKILTAGKLIYGVASDDAHDFTNWSKNPSERDHPGTGWISVKADELTQSNIMKGLREGQFYSSNGVELETLVYGENGIELSIKPEAGVVFWTLFTGEGGMILKHQTGLRAYYTYKGPEKYVRATVISSKLKKAWTQPQFLKDKVPENYSDF